MDIVIGLLLALAAAASARALLSGAKPMTELAPPELEAVPPVVCKNSAEPAVQ